MEYYAGTTQDPQLKTTSLSIGSIPSKTSAKKSIKDTSHKFGTHEFIIEQSQLYQVIKEDEKEKKAHPVPSTDWTLPASGFKKYV